MKILVIFTGGTIGSSKSDEWVSLDQKTQYTLLSSYSADDVEFDTASPYSLLSENLSGNELTLLCDEILKGVSGKYDGVIVAHGTDSLQYSATAAAFCAGCNSAPVIFVSSGYPLEDERANGIINFEAAVQFIKAKMGRGVYISYQNEPNGRVDIHAAARALRHPEMSDKVVSIGGPYAYYYEGKISLCKEYAPSAFGDRLGGVSFCNDSHILTVGVCPTERYNYCLDGVKAILLLPYHSGTLNTASKPFCRLCQKAKDSGIPIFLPSLPKDSAYESMKAYNELGIIPLTCSSVALTVKLWASISLERPIKEFVLNPLAQEFV